MAERARRGWREKIEAGLYRAHRTGCRSSQDRKPGRRCDCPFEYSAPGYEPGTTRTVTFRGSVSEARAERRAAMAAGRPARPAEPAAAADDLRAFAARYLAAAAARLAPSSVRTTADAYRLRVDPHLGHLPLDGLSREVLEVWVSSLVKDGASPDQVHKAIKAVRVIVAAAVSWGRLSENPARGLKAPKVDGAGGDVAARRVLGEDQLGRLLTVGVTHRQSGNLNLRLETMLRAGAEAGLRKGEVIGLRWPDLDLKTRRLTVERSVWQEPGRNGGPPRRIVKPPKSGRPRTVAISPTFAARLSEWFAVSVVERGADAAGYVWPGRGGEPMGEGTPGQALKRALVRAGLVDRTGEPLVTFHGLRHSCASILISRGVPLTVVARQLGHANPNITATIYAHLLDESQLDDAAAVFEAVETTETLGETLGGLRSHYRKPRISRVNARND